MLEYKGYHAVTEFRPDDGIIFGRVLDLSDVVVLESEKASDVEAAFRGAVDDDLEFCGEIGKDPDRPYSGRFNVRLSPELHRAASMSAQAEKESLNHFVGTAIAREVERRAGAS